MADYWISNPRHFCEACKCWMGDNKISIEFHQNGRRHKANVERQLRESRKRASVKEKEAVKLSETLEEIEKAAMAAYQRDQQGLPPAKRVATAPSVTLTPEIIQFEQQNIKKEMTKKLAHKKKELDEEEEKRQQLSSSPWQQLTSPEGYPYYYNTSTGVSQWEPPTDAPVYYTVPAASTSSTATAALSSTEEHEEETQKSQEGSSDHSDTDTKESSVKKKKPSSPSTESAANNSSYTSSYRAPYGAPYGAWTTISVREQLPTTTEDTSEVDNTSPDQGGNDNDGGGSDEEVTFQEKTLPTAANITNKSTFGNIEPGSFKGFGFKKKQNRTHNIKGRTSDW